MDVITTVEQLRKRLANEKNVALVPTMGNLHAGHIQLIKEVKPRAACLVTSIFVNRLQFGPSEDFNRYPRTLEADCAHLLQAGCDVVFAPDEKEIYPTAQEYTVDPSELQHVLEGAFRPGHFRGVATVVLKLFNMVQPQLAIFGKKDYQQYLVLKDMVTQLALPIEIVPAETVRATDGLALSSRNSYLSPVEREEAIQLYRQLSSIKQAIMEGNSDFNALETSATNYLNARGWQTDYIAIRSQDHLQEAQTNDNRLVVLGASRLGKTRLIDNLEIELR
ncbi:MAG: pantoate--beta-alanine ligase [Betaproteobacteria bacterium]|uniref:pantoate--beta-alanine ligase n=1 Tax=Ferrovum sp. PN-J185 TaxID=1356306 RepID=UPI00079A7A32|nr:pantothenate synthetase [Ferrovum sp. PN-J185]MDE1890922.1 pantoate--beta-alanine ligase [Betaproteobacteria bacterium]MDE2055766.1 pantoate--beta-alanine ligase [Betaproteobacteria bacterium]